MLEAKELYVYVNPIIVIQIFEVIIISPDSINELSKKSHHCVNISAICRFITLRVCKFKLSFTNHIIQQRSNYVIIDDEITAHEFLHSIDKVL